MAIAWHAVLKSVPWSEVISNALDPHPSPWMRAIRLPLPVMSDGMPLRRNYYVTD